MKYTFLICLIACLIACQSNTSKTEGKKSTTLTEAEQQAVLLTGTALSGQAVAALSPDGRSLELTVANSAAFEREKDLLRLHASRAAWVFYKNGGNEKPSYEQMVVKAQLKDTVVNFSYTVAELAAVKARFAAIEQVSQKLIKGDYEGLFALFDPVVMSSSSVASLKNYSTELDPKLGYPERFDFKGFSFDKISGGTPTLNLAGEIHRTIKPSPLSITLDMSKPDWKGAVLAMKFSY